MTVGRIIEGRDAVLTCNVSNTVSEAIGILAERRIGAMPVFDGETLAGMFSERDVIYRLHEFGPDILQRPVGHVMTTPPLTVEPETPVLTALAMMTQRRFRHLPVVQGGRMIGMVSIGDLVKYRIDKVESEAAAMREYIQMA